MVHQLLASRMGTESCLCYNVNSLSSWCDCVTDDMHCSDGVVVNDAVALDAAATVSQPAGSQPDLHTSNATSQPSYQYDSSGMTELSLMNDEVRDLL